MLEPSFFDVSNQVGVKEVILAHLSKVCPQKVLQLLRLPQVEGIIIVRMVLGFLVGLHLLTFNFNNV